MSAPFTARDARDLYLEHTSGKKNVRVRIDLLARLVGDVARGDVHEAFRDLKKSDPQRVALREHGGTGLATVELVG